MLSNEPLLWVEALRGKYLKHGISFLDAPSIPSASWIWKGLIKNRIVVEKGVCWSILDGSNINIWDSPWIPSMPSFKPRPNVNLVDFPDFSVADLLLPGSRLWNVDLLGDLFDPPTVRNILSIHIPRSSGIDKWSWAPSPSGLFSVKSARDISLQPSRRGSPLPPVVWQTLLGLKLQARLKHLLWKIAWNILPCRDNIGRFVYSEDVNAWVCPFCKGPLETLNHIFLECDLARILWRTSPWPLLISSFAARPISDWIIAIIYPSTKLDIPFADTRNFQIYAALVMDVIWFSRNKLIHEAIQPDIPKIIQQLKITHNYHILAWQASTLSSFWFPPQQGSVKGNFDVAVRGDFAVAAAVLSDHTGEIIYACTQKLLSTDVLSGEASAALLASRLTASLGFSFFTLEGDALLVILTVNKPHLFASWQFAFIVSDLRLELSSFQSWNASKVSRCANFRAHELAKWAATHLVFGSIPLGSPILSSIRIKNGKYPPL